jgi:ABC-type branched-subunit amino acid transport system substrate-binding protein
MASSCAKQYYHERTPRVANPRVLSAKKSSDISTSRGRDISYDRDFQYRGETLDRIDISKIEDKERELMDRRAQKRMESQGATKIAVLLPLSGSAKKVGNSLKNSIEMAYYDINNENIELSFYDTKGDASVAKEKAEMAVSEGADIFLGPLFSDSVKAVSNVAGSKYVISFTTDTSVLSDKTYSINYLKSQEMERIISYMGSNNLDDSVFLLPKGDLGEILEKTILEKSREFNIDAEIVFFDEKNQKELNSMVKKITNFSKREKDLKSMKAFINPKMKYCQSIGYKVDEKGKYDEDNTISYTASNRSEFETCKKYEDISLNLDKKTSLGKFDKDAIFIAGSNNSIISIGAFLAYYDVKGSETKIFGLSNFENKKIKSESIFRGSLYTSPNSTIDSSFKRKYKNTYGSNPISISQIAYDAMYLISSSDMGGYISEEYLLAPSGFLGSSGLFRLKYNGETERGVAVKKILSSRRVGMVSKSPKSFQEYYSGIYGKNISSSENAIKEYEKNMSLGYFNYPRSLEEVKENILLLNPETINSLIIK